MFPQENKPKNRRFQPHELETEKWLATLFKRPLRSFIHDHPYYPYLPPAPIVPFVNFDLNYNKGQH